MYFNIDCRENSKNRKASQQTSLCQEERRKNIYTSGNRKRFIIKLCVIKKKLRCHDFEQLKEYRKIESF